MDWTNVIVSVLVGVAAAAGAIAIYRLRSRAEVGDLPPTLQFWVQTLVRAAEQAYPGDASARRYYVVSELKARFPFLHDNIIRALLEAAVYQLNREQTKT